MGILYGSDFAGSLLQRSGRLLAGVITASVISAILYSAGIGWWQTRGWEQHQWNVTLAYFQRVNGAQWGSVLGPNPKSILPSKYHRLKITNNSQVLDQYLLKQYRPLRPAIKNTIQTAVVGAFAGGLMSLGLALLVGRLIGRRKLKRGAELVSPASLSSMAKAKGHKSDFDLAGVKVPGQIFYRHALILGSPGAGKSQLISDLLDQINAKKERAIIFDPGGEFYSTHRQRESIVLNPLDARTQGWDVLKEIQSPWDTESLANSAIQQSAGGNENEFFYQGARIVLAESLRILQSQKASTLDAYQKLTMSTVGDLHDWLQGTPAAAFLDPAAKGQGPGIQATLNTKLAAWKYLEASNNPFQIREWIRNGVGNVFLTSREDAHAALQPLISLQLEVAVTELLSRKSNQGERIWLIVDELASLQKLPALLRVLSQGRKYRVAVVAATQNPSQLQMVYGREGAAALSGTIGNRCVFRMEDVDDAAASAKFFGEAEIEEKKRSINAGARAQGTNLNDSREREQIILPSEIQMLPDLECYLKLAGGLPPALTKTKYKPRKATSQPFVARDIPMVSVKPSEPEEKPAIIHRGFIDDFSDLEDFKKDPWD